MTEPAEGDIQSALEFIARDKRPAAEEWLEEILERIYRPESFPLRAARIPESSTIGGDYRHLIFGQYRIIFRIDGKTVKIIRVIHAARLLELEE